MLEVWKIKKLRWLLVPVFVVLWGPVCYFMEDWDLSIGHDAKSRFADVPGSIAIVELELTRDKDRVLLVKQGVVSISDVRFEGPLDGVGYNAEPPFADHLPNPGEGRNYHGPYQTSPDGRYLAVSVRRVAYGPFSHLVILDARTYAELGRIDTPQSVYIESVAWAPDSAKLAILRVESTWPMFCPLDIFSYLVFHPQTRNDYYLEIFNPEGELQASAKLASQMSELGITRLVWF